MNLGRVLVVSTCLAESCAARKNVEYLRERGLWTSDETRHVVSESMYSTLGTLGTLSGSWSVSQVVK